MKKADILSMKKKPILSIIDSLEKVNISIARNLDANIAVQMETLIDCQDSAIAVGNEIEKQYKAREEIVHLLEAYCENLYQMSVWQSDLLKCKKFTKKIQKQLPEIRNHIKYDLPDDRKQVVFLPYKASMWDSLESVWRAADADPACDTFVVVLPYFSKNADGSLREVCYEGADFPADVPITDWRQYSLEQEHPDIIFFHNPYDDYNLVTTIHPDFYASKIRYFTDQLVYIPYFVYRNDRVEGQGCVMPGIIYADTVVLQSESVREQYIRYFAAVMPELVQAKGIKSIEQKFQALGSPKLDIPDADGRELPEEWNGFLAEGRKVIFFNTHLRGVMEGESEQFFKKLEWVFDFFQRQKEMTLLWRPHPLMLDTAKAMNPEAVEPYLRLVDRYRKEKIGIYDDSKDLHRAIQISDAYYGDQSSVVELFRHQGKPIMIMDHNIIGN